MFERSTDKVMRGGSNQKRSRLDRYAAATACWDHAPMESLNGMLKVECVHGEHFRTRSEAYRAMVEYIGYYNTQRRHFRIG